MAGKIRTWLLMVCFFGIVSGMQAQSQEDEYKMELGAAMGVSYYLGDANYLVPYKDLGWCGGVVARFNLNQRMQIKTNLLAAKIAGDTRNFHNKYPNNGVADFSRVIYDLGAQFEYNFLPYGTGRGFNGGKRFTPYLFAGLGMTFAPKPLDTVFTLNFPIGVGVKYKLAPRWNIGFEVSMRFSMSDRLDVTRAGNLELEDPYQIKGKGFKNNDSYSFTVFYITYDLFAKCKDCNN